MAILGKVDWRGFSERVASEQRPEWDPNNMLLFLSELFNLLLIHNNHKLWEVKSTINSTIPLSDTLKWNPRFYSSKQEDQMVIKKTDNFKNAKNF